MDWSDVERLFLRLLHTVRPVQYAKLFGVPGQAQGGIDAYARLPLDLAHGETSGRDYITLQSRRIRTLTAAKIEEAVDDFLAGEWADRTARFYFATSFDLQDTKLDRAIREQTERLAELKITFVPWGVQEVSGLLKDQPRIVDDFFGRPWVERFCGAEAAQGLAHNLPQQDSRELRAELRDLYHAVFSAQGGVHPVDDAEAAGAFVVLDVDPSRPWPDRFDAEQPEPAVEDPRLSQDSGDGDTYVASRLGDSRQSFRSAHQLLRHSNQGRPAAVATMAADEWLASGKYRLLIGRPGAGKSSLLRFVAVDLLSAQPQSVPLQRQHGTDLPVWLPFGYLCRHLEGSTENSLFSAVEAWLRSQSAAHLWPLVERALRDDRLLLLIDGIDEWSDVSAAERALGTLEAFLGRTTASAILSTRPYAVDRLNWSRPWAQAEITPLTDRQRWTIAAAVLGSAAGSLDAAATPAMWSGGIETFLAQLETIPELAELSRSPLFLTLLATTWQGEPLPRQRFKIYARLVELLVEKHPQMRQRASHAHGAVLTAAEATTLFAAVAYRLRVKDPAGTVTKAEMRALIVEAMTDDQVLGYPRPEARRVADAVLTMAEDEFGLIVSHGAGTFGFLHRVVLDHLAGQHLATRPAEEQRTVVQRTVQDPAWRDVLLALLTAQISSHTTQPLLAAALDTGTQRWADIDGYELLAQALAAGAKLTPKAQSVYLNQLVERVETHPSLPHRANLIVALTGMLASHAARTHLLPVMKRWLTALRPAPSPTMWALRDLDIGDDMAAEYLLWGMRHTDEQVKVNAAAAIAHRFGGQAHMLERLIMFTETGPSSATQAAALLALGRGWPDTHETTRLVAWARRQPSVPLRLVALQALQRGTPSGDVTLYRREERDWLLSLLHREDVHVGPWPTADLVNLAATANPQAADFALETLRTNGRNGGDRRLAWGLACHVFADDNRFKTWVAEQLSAPEQHGLILYNAGTIPQQWRDDPDFAQALHSYVDKELSGIASYQGADLVDALPPAQAQSLLLRSLDGYRPYAAARVLVEQHADDEQVRTVLTHRLRGDFDQAAPMAGVAVDVLGPQEGFAVLVSLLRQSTADHGSEKHVVVAEAIAEAWKTFERTVSEHRAGATAAREVLAAYDPAELAALCTAVSPDPLMWHVSAVISAWPDQPAVQEFADRLIYDTRPIIAGIADTIPVAILRAYSNRTDVSSRRILDKTLGLLKYIGPELREVLVFELAHSALSVTELVDVMREWKNEPDTAIRRTAFIGLTQVIKRHQQAHNDLGGSATWTAEMEWLRGEIRDELCAYGPELEERRQLAWIGMLMLGDLTLMDGISETIGRPDAPSVTLDVLYGDVDRILVDLVAENWEQLRSHFGEQVFERLNGRTGERTASEQRRHVMSALATAASRYPAIAELLRDETDNDAALRQDERFLAWAKEENRGDEGVLRAVVTTLDRTHHRESNDLDSLLDRDSWNVSDELFKAILTEETISTRSGFIRDGDGLAAYTQLFPSDPLAVAAFRDLETWWTTDREARVPRQWSSILAIAFGAAPPGDLPALAIRAHTRFRLDGSDGRLSMFTKPLLRRLRTDTDAIEAFKGACSEPMRICEDSPIMADPWDPIACAYPDMQALQRRYLFAVVLRQAGALPQADAAAATRILESASPDTVVRNPFTHHEGPLCLAVLDLAVRSAALRHV
ncbi:NACHT domain-containing protein [Streptomyces lincolnensis]|uniref:NACHT domain-containing protein n=1 Tax=Streptomyces lincolnensis TaxID=1915 RepID=UPI001E343FA7|nr:NACHT domain-containing protein [Streptomyces lincolnensis]MCD7444767.1 NACHT domain-containing protein [Streptomyces lincolnensis]